MIVTFDTTIYREQAIRKAIEDYREIAEIYLNPKKDNYECSITRSKYSMKKTVLEFSNYVLNLTVMDGIN